MQTLMVYSETGGVTKTTTAVSLATIAARQGMSVVLVDLDPRAASTKWLNLQPKEEGLHVGAILGNENPEGWAEDIAVTSYWSPNLRLIPSGRSVSNREADRADQSEVRLRTSFQGLNADLVVIDCPNRQGGPLTLSALTASDTVVYAAKLSADGVDGVVGARRTVDQFRLNRERIGAPSNINEAGIVAGSTKTTIMSRPAATSLEELRETKMLLLPLVPERAIVAEVRQVGDWYGDYQKGEPVLEAYTEIAEQVIQ